VRSLLNHRDAANAASRRSSRPGELGDQRGVKLLLVPTTTGA